MKTKRKPRGFTLIEVVIAITILAGGIVVVANSWSGNYLRVRKTRLYNNVAILLQRKLTEIESQYKGKPLEQIPDEDKGDFGSELKQYRWEMSSQDFEMPDLSSVLINDEDGADEMLLTVIRKTTEFINQSVKEVTVTVIVKTPKKDVKYDVTTYFVDFNKELALGGL